ncbi:MAG: anti-sigma F factor antagonist [Clostridiales bacterium GWE2_32_10]|nr:MAG: anti-sigma F factor antagonist [Clostridiales bacterium GWE2_32_10]HBY21717.1 anti-sigma F factor antagonist [Clostridiales bacterium]
MKLVYKCIGKNMVVKFIGEIDHHQSKTVREEIDSVIYNDNIKNIIFDFSNVDFMDSSGIGMILGRYKKVEDKDGKIFLVNVRGNLDDIFKISGLYSVAQKYNTVSEALEVV